MRKRERLIKEYKGSAQCKRKRLLCSIGNEQNMRKGKKDLEMNVKELGNLYVKCEEKKAR